jgi:hypothetical protein
MSGAHKAPQRGLAAAARFHGTIRLPFVAPDKISFDWRDSYGLRLNKFGRMADIYFGASVGTISRVRQRSRAFRPIPERGRSTPACGTARKFERADSILGK